jgi:nicotinate phosphoribosyltransferase
MQIDKYHARMAEDSLLVKKFDKHGNSLYHTKARFYVTQRKLKYAPVLGHERLAYDLRNNLPNAEERRFMLRHDISMFPGELMSEVDREGVGQVRTVKPGTIMFANEPIADIEGCFGTIQSQEISFEHAFDLPMTVASRAMKFKRAAKQHAVMNFSLRRNGDRYRDADVNRFAYIAGFDKTSSLSGAMAVGLNSDDTWVGTAAHYWQQAFSGEENQEGVHWQQRAFEAQLDAADWHGVTTTLLLDTISTKIGAVHAAAAAKSSPERMNAFGGFRIDSGELGPSAVDTLLYMKSQDITKPLNVVLTGDLDEFGIELARNVLEVNFPGTQVTFGVGTKLAAEVENVAGVIFKLSEINEKPTLKCSDNPKKATLPGKVQVWRVLVTEKDGNQYYKADVIGVDKSHGHSFQYVASEYPAEIKRMVSDLEAVGKSARVIPLLRQFNPEAKVISVEKQKAFVEKEIKLFRNHFENYKVICSKELEDLKSGIIQEYHNG